VALLTSHGGKLDFGVWFFGTCTIVFVLKPILRRFEPPAKDRVEFDERGIRRYRSNGPMEEIEWSELDEIGIVTTDEGPWVDDVIWLFSNADQSNGCAVSNYSPGFSELLSRIQALPGFDNEAVVRAMGSTSNDRFVVWKKHR
jgi:hypothetical protein